MVTLEARVYKPGQVHGVPIDHCRQFADSGDTIRQLSINWNKNKSSRHQHKFCIHEMFIIGFIFSFFCQLMYPEAAVVSPWARLPGQLHIYSITTVIWNLWGLWSYAQQSWCSLMYEKQQKEDTELKRTRQPQRTHQDQRTGDTDEPTEPQHFVLPFYPDKDKQKRRTRKEREGGALGLGRQDVSSAAVLTSLFQSASQGSLEFMEEQNYRLQIYLMGTLVQHLNRVSEWWEWKSRLPKCPTALT